MPSTMKNFIHVGKSEIVKYIFVDLPQYLLNSGGTRLLSRKLNSPYILLQCRTTSQRPSRLNNHYRLLEI